MIPVFQGHLVTHGFGRKIKPVFPKCITFDAMLTNPNTEMTASFVTTKCIVVRAVLNKASLALLSGLHLIIVAFATTMLADCVQSHSTTATMSEKEPGQSLQASKSILLTFLIGSRG